MKKPFSTYPEDHARMLMLADVILSRSTDQEDAFMAAVELADLVQAILRDEALDEEEPT